MKLDENTKKELIQKIDEMEDWERLETSIKGVNIIKPPEFNEKQPVFISVTINDKQKGGIFIRSIEDFKKLKKIVATPELEALITFVDDYYFYEKEKVELRFKEE